MQGKLVEESRHSHVTIGHVGLATQDGAPVSVPRAVHDGDTISTHALANISIRFLGVDTPEITFPLPGENAFRSVGSDEWEAFLSDPFAEWPGATKVLGAGLRQYLAERCGPGAAKNHRKHAERAREELRKLVQADMEDFVGGDPGRFNFFLRYARDVIDRYGRLLAYTNIDVDDPKSAPAKTYNERMLALGFAAPYFIWPNLDPFKKQPNLFDAVPEPGRMAEIASAGRLGEARQWVRDARAARLGIWGEEALRVQPFELRFLSQRRAPDRWVIDLSSDQGLLLSPRDYHVIPNAEDRLYVPAEYVSLFEMNGWSTSEA